MHNSVECRLGARTFCFHKDPIRSTDEQITTDRVSVFCDRINCSFEGCVNIACELSAPDVDALAEKIDKHLSDPETTLGTVLFNAKSVVCPGHSKPSEN